MEALAESVLAERARRLWAAALDGSVWTERFSRADAPWLAEAADAANKLGVEVRWREDRPKKGPKRGVSSLVCHCIHGGDLQVYLQLDSEAPIDGRELAGLVGQGAWGLMVLAMRRERKMNPPPPYDVVADLARRAEAAGFDVRWSEAPHVKPGAAFGEHGREDRELVRVKCELEDAAGRTVVWLRDVEPEPEAVDAARRAVAWDHMKMLDGGSDDGRQYRSRFGSSNSNTQERR